MAGQRRIGLLQIRSNPRIAGYNLTGMNDHVMGGEGVNNNFRELKPALLNAMFEELAPLAAGVFLPNKEHVPGKKLSSKLCLQMKMLSRR